MQANRIAVLRGGGLGDLVFTLPALEALRARFPVAEITLIGEPWLAGLVLGRRAVDGGPALVDRHVPLPAAASAWLAGRGGPADARASQDVASEVAARAPDLAIQLNGGGRHSNPFLTSLGAAVTVGLRAPDAPPLDRWVPYVYYQSEVMRALEVVGLLGATPVSIEPRVLPGAPVDGPLPGGLGGEGGPLVALHPAASDARRCWPARSFGELARRLSAAGARVAVVGVDGDRHRVREICEVAGPQAGVVDLAGRLDLPALERVLARASVVVANDSGPIHLARALGARTVGIYWCGNVINAGPAWRARHRPAISWRLECPECGLDCTRHRCGHDVSFVADVTVDEVGSSALELLDATTDDAAETRMMPAWTTATTSS